jgi:hypothetical protein
MGALLIQLDSSGGSGTHWLRITSNIVTIMVLTGHLIRHTKYPRIRRMGNRNINIEL